MGLPSKGKLEFLLEKAWETGLGSVAEFPWILQMCQSRRMFRSVLAWHVGKQRLRDLLGRGQSSVLEPRPEHLVLICCFVADT